MLLDSAVVTLDRNVENVFIIISGVRNENRRLLKFYTYGLQGQKKKKTKL